MLSWVREAESDCTPESTEPSEVHVNSFSSIYLLRGPFRGEELDELSLLVSLGLMITKQKK